MLENVTLTMNFLKQTSSVHMCCMEHDFCYSSCTIPQAQCDASFCGCLATLSADWYCRNMVYLAHCNLVTWYAQSYFYSKQSSNPCSNLRMKNIKDVNLNSLEILVCTFQI